MKSEVVFHAWFLLIRIIERLVVIHPCIMTEIWVLLSVSFIALLLSRWRLKRDGSSDINITRIRKCSVHCYVILTRFCVTLIDKNVNNDLSPVILGIKCKKFVYQRNISLEPIWIKARPTAANYGKLKYGSNVSHLPELTESSFSAPPNFRNASCPASKTDR